MKNALGKFISSGRSLLVGRLIAPAVGALGLGLALMVAAAPTPALASGTLVVDDDKVQCPTAAFTTIQSAVNAAVSGSTIKVCTGTYVEHVQINAKNNLKLVAAGQVIVEAPLDGGVAAHGPIIQVNNSLNVTVSGFGISGAFSYQTSGTNIIGIDYEQSSGTITRNIVEYMRRTPPDTTIDGYGIMAANASGVLLPVKIIRNTVEDFQYAGIYATGNVAPTITGNYVQQSSLGAFGFPAQPAIGLVQVATGKVTANYVSNSPNGILIQASSNVKVNANRLNDNEDIFLLSVNCQHTDNNQITGNRLRDSSIVLWAEDIALPCAGSVNSNLVSGNKLYSYQLTLGINGIQVNEGPVTPPHATANRVIGNVFYGYGATPIENTGTGTILSGNKSLPMPPGGQ